MKKSIHFKAVLPLVLAGVLATPLWAQDKSEAAQLFHTSAAETLSQTETQQFFDEIRTDLAKDGYQIHFGKNLPKVSIKPPKVILPVAEKDIDKPMSDKEKQQFFNTLQNHLSKSGIYVDFGKNLPNVKRIAPQPDTACQEDLAELMLERYSDNLKENELLEELLSEHYGAELPTELMEAAALATDSLDDDAIEEAEILAALIEKHHDKATETKALTDLKIGDDVTIELLETLLEKAKKQR